MDSPNPLSPFFQEKDTTVLEGAQDDNNETSNQQEQTVKTERRTKTETEQTTADDEGIYKKAEVEMTEVAQDDKNEPSIQQNREANTESGTSTGTERAPAADADEVRMKEVEMTEMEAQDQQQADTQKEEDDEHAQGKEDSTFSPDTPSSPPFSLLQSFLHDTSLPLISSILDNIIERIEYNFTTSSAQITSITSQSTQNLVSLIYTSPDTTWPPLPSSVNNFLSVLYSRYQTATAAKVDISLGLCPVCFRACQRPTSHYNHRYQPYGCYNVARFRVYLYHHYDLGDSGVPLDLIRLTSVDDVPQLLPSNLTSIKPILDQDNSYRFQPRL
jgi:hypothetical protein